MKCLPYWSKKVKSFDDGYHWHGKDGKRHSFNNQPSHVRYGMTTRTLSWWDKNVFIKSLTEKK